MDTPLRANLQNLLAKVKSIGYEEIEVSFHPQGANSPLFWPALSVPPAVWPSAYENIFQENWNLIFNLRPIIAAAGILYRIDLLNEGTPQAGQVGLRQYAQRLWGAYVFTFGKSDTVGFSLIGEAVRASQVQVVYGPSPWGNYGAPYLFDVHFYANAYNQFAAVDASLDSQGLGSEGWIVGESYYNDATEAQELRTAANNSGFNRTVFYVAQWPVRRVSACGGNNTDVAPPSSFSNYIAWGF